MNKDLVPLPDVGVELAGLKLSSCLFNASGPRCTDYAELQALAGSAAGAVLSKSCTLEPRLGNPEPRYADTPWGSINSMGLPNRGYLYYAQAKAHLRLEEGKPYFVSVSGMSFDDNVHIVRYLQDCPVDAIELNLSCPNLVGKPQTGYDPEQSRKLLQAVLQPGSKVPLGVKLPPYFDIVHFHQMAQVLNDLPIAFVTCINSIGNGLVVNAETETTLIRPKEGLGGIGGDFIKPTALANVRLFRQLLRSDIAVIGCGGVRSGSDAFEHILCGADAVQIGTQLYKEGTACFQRIQSELQSLMQVKGYTCLADFRNRLKTL